GDLGGVQAELVDQHLAGPHAGGHRVGTHADLLALEVLGRVDAGVGAHQQAAVVEAADHEDGQADERGAGRAGGDVGGGGDLADVELDVAHHAAERADLRLDGHELRVHAFDGDGAVTDGRGVRVFRDGDLEVDFLFGQGMSPEDGICRERGADRGPARVF